MEGCSDGAAVAVKPIKCLLLVWSKLVSEGASNNNNFFYQVAEWWHDVISELLHLDEDDEEKCEDDDYGYDYYDDHWSLGWWQW